MIDYNVTKVNGDPQPPDEVNNVFAEAKTMVSSLGIAFDSGSYQQLAESIAVLVMNGQFFIDSGTANTYVLSVSPVTRKAPPIYFIGMMVAFVAANASTGASTINISGLGGRNIKQPDGTPILTNDILTTGLTTLYYDGTNFVLMKNPVNLASGAEVKGILPVANGGTGVSDDTYDADKLDGQHGSYYRDMGNANAGTLPTGRGGTGATAAANAANGVVIPTGAVNAANGAVVLGADGYAPNETVDTTALKTASGEVSETATGGSQVKKTLPGGEYGFFPQTKMSSTLSQAWGAFMGNPDTARAGWTSYGSYLYVRANNAGTTIYARQRYVTASGTDWFIFLRVDKDGMIKSLYSSSDHPSYGMGGDYKKMPHPFEEIGEYKIILLDKETVKQLKKESTEIDEQTGDKLLATLINENYKVNMSEKKVYQPLHSGKYKKALKNGKEVVTKQMIKTIPDYVSVRKLARLTQTEKDERKRKHKLEQEKYDMAQAQKLVNKANGIIKLKALGLSKEEIEAII